MESQTADPAPLVPPVPLAEAVPPSVAASAPRARSQDLLALLALCVLVDLCLYGRTGGAGQAALLVTAPLLLFLAARRVQRSWRLLAVGGAVVALASRLLWHPSALTLALGAAAVVAFPLALRSKRSFLPDLAVSTMASMAASFGNFWRLIRGAVAMTRPGRLLGGYRWVSVVAPVAVVAVFVAIFALANPVVEDWTRALWALATGSGSNMTPVRALVWLATALVAAMLLEPVLREPRLNERLGPGHTLAATDAVPGDATRATARNILLAVNVLFLVYNALDAAYLWAGRLPPRIGYTEYAHRGATWLTLSLVVSTIVLGVLFRGAMSFAAEARRTRVLGYVWAVQNLILAAGTLRRIDLYVDHSGLTTLLLLGVLGTLLVCAGLALIVVKLARRRTGLWLVRRQLDALAIAVVLFAVLPTEAIAGWFNAGRVEQGHLRPLMHLFLQPLTAEGVPALASLLDHPNPVVQRGAAGLLRRERRRLSRADEGAQSWTQWEGSRSRALSVIEATGSRTDVVDSPDDEYVAIDRLRALAFRCRSSVAKPLTCEPPPPGWGQRPRTPLDAVRIRPMHADAGPGVVK